jgi:asparagine synthase (glutamine-hydrolysing)
MCGIAGYIMFKGTPAERELRRMGQTLMHRGPDDFGVHIDGPVGIAHTRLSIIDLAGGHQPLFDKNGTLALVANGEIYNFVELRQELEKKSCEFLTRSDSETILHAYAVYGEGFLGRLNGMYAFALYDSRKRQLILGRDRLGIKPLYYVQLPDRLAFASEIKALLPVLPHPPQIDPTSLMEFFQNRFVSGENTLFADVKRVMPGEALIVGGDPSPTVRRLKYWSLLDVKPVDCSYEEAREAFDRLLPEVMREHVRSDVPYGLFLSGGVDSAVLLSQLVHYQDKPVRSFSIGYASTTDRNELDGAERMAKLFQTDHTAFVLSDDAVFRRIPHMVWATDDLMQDYASLPTSILAQEAGRELKVVFSGEGGDEVFAGYGSYRKSAAMRRLRRLISPDLRGIRLKGKWSKSISARALGPELAELADAYRTPFAKAVQAMPGEWSFVQTAQANDIVGNMENKLLVKADRMLMAFGLEGRVPYLDHRIVEFGFSLPDRLKIQSRHQGKVILKRYAEAVIPRDHLNQKKRGFHMPADKLMSGAFLERLEQKLLGNPAVKHWFVPEGVRALFARQKSGKKHTEEIWSLMQFAIWHCLFVEHPDRRPSPDEHPLDWIS